MRTVAGDFDYDARGHGYAAQRQPDPRIATMVHEALGDSRSVVNVGAGAGSYEPADRQVVAVEPSAVMRAQRPGGAAPVVAAVAERLPFRDDSFDAAMAMVTVHQWPSAEQGLREMRRVARHTGVVLTFDGSALYRYWLGDYCPELLGVEAKRYPTIEHVIDALGGSGEAHPVPIPIDCTDGFTEAYYARPEKFLDPGVRAAQSAWGFVSADAQQRTVNQLRADLESGAWDKRYGEWRSMPQFVGSLRLVVAQVA